MNARSASALATVSALFATLVASPAATARAQIFEDSDVVGDVSDLTDETTATPAPDQTLSDVRATRLAHGATRVAVRVDYVDLQKVGESQAIFVDLFSDERSRRLQLAAYPGGWSGETQMYTARWREVSCGGVRHSIDYAAETMKVSFPRRCLGNPRWVNFRVVALAEDDGFFADDALSDAPISSQDGNWLKWSGRVRRG